MKKKAKTKKKVKVSESALEDLGSWLMPQIMYRPQRRDYILKVNQPKDCVFCSALQKGKSVDSLIVHESKKSFVILNKFPYNTGHLLVVPKRHCEHLEELNQDEYIDFQDLALTTIKVLKTSFNCAGINAGMNLGVAAGAGIPKHLHQHIIPRWIGDTNFLPLVARSKVMIETLPEVYQRISPRFEEISHV